MKKLFENSRGNVINLQRLSVEPFSFEQSSKHSTAGAQDKSMSREKWILNLERHVCPLVRFSHFPHLSFPEIVQTFPVVID